MALGEVGGGGGGGGQKVLAKGRVSRTRFIKVFFYDLDMGVWWWIFGMYIEMYVEVC
jgi:hypothetical protein